MPRPQRRRRRGSRDGAADPERLGGLAWTGRASAGRAERDDGRRARSARRRDLAGRVKLALGRLPAGAEELDARRLPRRRTARSRARRRRPAREQSDAVAGHSHRTWIFGSALAALDGVALDRSSSTSARCCTTSASSSPSPARTSRCAAPSARSPAGPAPASAQQQAELDRRRDHGPRDARDHRRRPTARSATTCRPARPPTSAGFRLWDLPKPLVSGAVELHPRHGVEAQDPGADPRRGARRSRRGASRCSRVTASSSRSSSAPIPRLTARGARSGSARHDALRPRVAAGLRGVAVARARRSRLRRPARRARH